MSDLTVEAIQRARERIRDAIFYSPCAFSESLSRMTGCQLFLKLENLQMTGSFKDRGSLNKILQLSDRDRDNGVITASAGNHAQGVAHAARLVNTRATIVMPETTPLSKIRGTRELGAEIILHGASYDEAFDKAQALQREQGCTFIHAFDDPDVIAGQGTIGLELLEQVPDMDLVVAPIGGGGLLSGIAMAIKSARPQVELVGVEAERIPAMKASIQAGRVVPARSANTLADGIAVARVGTQTLEILRRSLSDIVTVTEEEIAYAVMTLLEREKTLAEGAGAVGFAALYNGRIPSSREKRVVVVISGGNIDMTVLAKILERGLETDGRLSRLSVVVPDKPGNTAKVAAIIGDLQANILQISQDRSISKVQLEESELELVLETRGRDHLQEIVSAVRAAGYTVR